MGYKSLDRQRNCVRIIVLRAPDGCLPMLFKVCLVAIYLATGAYGLRVAQIGALRKLFYDCLHYCIICKN